MDISKKYRLEVLKGCHRDTNALYALKSNWIALNNIFEKVDEWQDSKYREHIDRDTVAFETVTTVINPLPMRGRFAFPEPTGVRVNMMPIKLRDESTFPDFCKPYLHMIRSVRWMQQLLDPDHVSYLTIDESVVEPGESQRRPGLHIERPGRVMHGGRIVREGEDGFRELAWGLGMWKSGTQFPVDGIYMASNVTGSCAIYPLQITSPADVVDEHGGIEHMRHLLGEPQLLDEGELCWFTDTTPHESLPIASDVPVQRSFFRIVVGRISVWYSKHNTTNPTGLAPDAPISDDDKFWGAGLPPSLEPSTS